MIDDYREAYLKALAERLYVGYKTIPELLKEIEAREDILSGDFEEDVIILSDILDE